jgi:hypothetical protein
MLKTAIEEVSNYVEGSRVKETIRIKQIGAMFRGRLGKLIEAKAVENQIECKYNLDRNEIVAVSLNVKDVDRFRNMVESEVEYLLNLERMELNANKFKSEIVVFPTEW